MAAESANSTPDTPAPKPNHVSRRWVWAVAAIAVIAVAVPSVLALGRSMKAEETGPKLTHTITRGDLVVTVVEQGLLESGENTEIKCGVRGFNTVLWVIESGTVVKKGDSLVRLDKLQIQEQIDERTKYMHWSRSAAERSAADLVAAKLAVDEYQSGRFIAQKMLLEKDLAVAEATLTSAKNMLAYAQRLSESEYISELEVEEKTFAVDQAKLDVDVKRTQLEVLENFTKAEQLQTLTGNLASTRARHKANAERAMADLSRQERALGEIVHCDVVAPRDGMVIHPNAAKWESRPIAEGSNVHKDQVLLLMPDLSQMQVKVGVHESVVDRVKPGLVAKVTLPDKQLKGKVNKVASVTRPAGWWTGNEVRYDTMVALPQVPGLMPGMSAEVELVIATYEDVLTVPVAAVVETDQGSFCWVKPTTGAAQRRRLELGDSNDVFSIVESGLKAGEEVVLNPLAIPEAKELAETKAERGVAEEAEASDVGKANQPPAKPSSEPKSQAAKGQQKNKAGTNSSVPKPPKKKAADKKKAPAKKKVNNKQAGAAS